MTTQDSNKLPLVPPSFFGIILGLAGLGGAWRAAHTAWGLPAAIGEAIYAVAFLAWAIIALLYALKWVYATDIASDEAKHAVQCCFIGLAGVATMLVAQGVLPYARPLAVVIYVFGFAFTLLFALWRTGYLWRGGRDPAATTPVLYLPLVAGGFVTGIGAAALGWRAWGELAFGAAFFGWLAIESVLLHRFYTAEPMAPALRPTLGIQLAPPAVGAACYLAISGGHSDLLPHMMYGYAVLQALILIRMSRWIGEQPFSAAYWAFTFGATAMATAGIRMSVGDQDGVYTTLAPVVFVLTNVLVVGIAIGTVRLLFLGKLVPPAPAKPAVTR